MVTTRKTASSMQSEYEKQRQLNIEKNAMRFQQLGLSKLANELIHKAKGCKRKEQEPHVCIDEEDHEYMPDENEDNDPLSEEEEQASENVVCGLNANGVANKVDKVMTRRQVAAARKDQPLCPAMSMADFIQQQKQQESTQSVCEDHVIQDREGQRLSFEMISRSEEDREETVGQSPGSH